MGGTRGETSASDRPPSPIVTLASRFFAESKSLNTVRTTICVFIDTAYSYSEGLVNEAKDAVLSVWGCTEVEWGVLSPLRQHLHPPCLLQPCNLPVGDPHYVPAGGSQTTLAIWEPRGPLIGASERGGWLSHDPWRSLGRQEGRGPVWVGRSQARSFGGGKELMKFQDVVRSASSRVSRSEKSDRHPKHAS